MIFPFKKPIQSKPTRQQIGEAAEAQALQHLTQAGLRLMRRNYRSPGRGGGEIDLIMAAPDGTVVFVEVRQRSGTAHGGAAASVSRTKQQRIIFTARHFLLRLATLPPCRFDVVAIDADGLRWIQAAFDAGL
jgi:putative endonuclease